MLSRSPTNGGVRSHLRGLLMRGRPVGPEDRTVVIYSGLSVRVRGHLVEVLRDETRRTATVVVSVLPDYQPDGSERFDVSRAAELMAGRAQRFLGQKWTVVPWGEEEE